jgi:hypothetical protein
MFHALGTSFLACNTHSSLVTRNYFILFQSHLKIEKDKKNQIFQKEGMGNIHFFFGNRDSLPWTNHILSFSHQALGSSTTL